MRSLFAKVLHKESLCLESSMTNDDRFCIEFYEPRSDLRFTLDCDGRYSCKCWRQEKHLTKHSGHRPSYSKTKWLWHMPCQELLRAESTLSQIKQNLYIIIHIVWQKWKTRHQPPNPIHALPFLCYDSCLHYGACFKSSQYLSPLWLEHPRNRKSTTEATKLSNADQP